MAHVRKPAEDEDHRRTQQPQQQDTGNRLNVDATEADTLRELPINTPDQSGNAEYAEPPGADTERLARERDALFPTDAGRGDVLYGGAVPVAGDRMPHGARSIRDELERDVNANLGDAFDPNPDEGEEKTFDRTGRGERED